MSRFALIALVLISTLFSFQALAQSSDVIDEGNECYLSSQVKLLSKSIIRRASGHKISYACFNEECDRMNFVIYFPKKDVYCEINSENAVFSEDLLETASEELVDRVKDEKTIYYPYALTSKAIKVWAVNDDAPVVRFFAFMGLIIIVPAETAILPLALVAAPYTIFDKMIAPLKVKKALATKKKDQKVNKKNFNIILKALKEKR